MLTDLSEVRQPEEQIETTKPGADRQLQAILWALWTLAVAATAFWQWRADVIAQRPVDLLSLVIYSLLTGTIGMVVLTMVEIWLEPQRFVD